MRRNPCMTQRVRRLSRQPAEIVVRARQHGDRHQVDQLAPAPPARQLFKKVGADHQHEAHMRKATAQLAQRVEGETRVPRALQPRRDDAPPVGDGAGRGETLAVFRHVARRLERIARRDQQPDLVEAQASAGEVGDVAVAFMRRIERAAEQAHANPPPVAPYRQTVLTQARTCPLP